MTPRLPREQGGRQQRCRQQIQLPVHRQHRLRVNRMACENQCARGRRASPHQLLENPPQEHAGQKMQRQRHRAIAGPPGPEDGTLGKQEREPDRTVQAAFLDSHRVVLTEKLHGRSSALRIQPLENQERVRLPQNSDPAPARNGAVHKTAIHRTGDLRSFKSQPAMPPDQADQYPRSPAPISTAPLGSVNCRTGNHPGMD